MTIRVKFFKLFEGCLSPGYFSDVFLSNVEVFASILNGNYSGVVDGD